jgi:hypothetical protein
LALRRLAVEWRAKGETGEVQRLLRCLQAIRVGTLKIAGQDVSGAQFVVRRSSETRKCTNSASTSHVFASRWVEPSVSDCASFQSPSIYQGELLDRLNPLVTRGKSKNLSWLHCQDFTQKVSPLKRVSIPNYGDRYRQLRETFVRWCPGMQTEQETEIQKKAA